MVLCNIGVYKLWRKGSCEKFGKWIQKNKVFELHWHDVQYIDMKNKQRNNNRQLQTA